MLRRGFLGGAAASSAGALSAGAQQPRRIGVLMDLTEDDPEGRIRIDAIRADLARVGWVDGANARLVVRWGGGVAERMQAAAMELAALHPDAIFAYGSPAVAALKRATSTTPVVFVSVADPIGAGFVSGMARPGANITGFMLLEFSVAVKWLELLKEVEPRIARVGVLRDASLASGIGQFAAIQAVAPSVGVEAVPIDVRDAAELESSIAALAMGVRSGLVVTAGTLTTLHRDLIVSRATRNRLPAIYSNRLFVAEGGLMSYSPDRLEQIRRAAGYIDRILKGEKPADLPIQSPTRYEFAINLATARALGLTVPRTLIARAEEVIE